MIPAEHHLLRVTVISPFGQHEIDLPADVPVSSFLPDLLAMAGLHPSPARLASDGWQLADAEGSPLPADRTLAAHGIRPGAVMQLRGAQDGGLPGRPANGEASASIHARASGGISPQIKSALSRHLPRPGVPSSPPGDSLTPLQRAEAVLPQRVGHASRIIAAGGAFFSGPVSAPGARPDAPLPPDEQIPPEGPQNPERHAGQPRPASDQGAQRAEGAPRLTADHRPAGGRLLPADLTVEITPSKLERVRTRWRELDHIGQLDARICEPRLMHCATIAVVSPKGGVGKTTVTALLGTLLSLLRRDPIVAVDTNPDFGSLGRVLTPDQSWYVDDLVRLVEQDDELSLTSLDSMLGRAIHGLLVVPAPTDPLRMAALDEDAYRRVITRLKDFFSLILLDCGTGLQDPASAAAIATADQVVLLTDAQPATASLVAESAELLHQWGRPITVVVNRMPARGAQLDLHRLSRYVPAAQGLVVIPDDVIAATRLAAGSFDWRDAPGGWQLAARRLAVVLVSDWGRLGLAR